MYWSFFDTSASAPQRKYFPSLSLHQSHTKRLICALGTCFGTFRTDIRAVGAALTANTNGIDTILADTAVDAVVALTADTVKADAALGADFIVCTVHALFAACGADIGAVRTSAAADADHLDAILTYTAFGTVIALAALTVKADTAFGADFIIRAVHAFIAASGTDFRTLRAALAAGSTNHIHAVFTFAAVDTEVAVTADAVHTDSAVLADTAVCTVFACFIAFPADERTLRASASAVTDRIHAFYAKLAFGTVVPFAASAVKAIVAILTKRPNITNRTHLAAIGTADRTPTAALSAVADPVGTVNAEQALGAV